MKLQGLVASIVTVGVLALVSPVLSQTSPPPAPPAGEMKEGAKDAPDEMKKEKKPAKKSSKKHKKPAPDSAKAPEPGMKGEADKGTGDTK